jgi:TP901 family phage tail tape measure protein
MATADVSALVLRIAADASSLKRELDNAGKSVKSFETKTSKAFTTIGKKMQSVGKSMSMYVTLPIVAGFTAGIKAFADFDKAMTQSTAIMTDMNSKLRADMAETARQISLESPTSATKAAEAYFFLASAGLSAEESMRSLRHVNNFAIAGQFDMATATDLLTDAQSALGMSIGTTAMKTAALVRVSDVLVKANTLANATVEQFSTALTSKAGASLRNFGKEIEEGVAVLAVFADQGIKAELAGNNLDRVLRLLAQASSKNQKEFRKLGFSVFDSDGNMRNFADIIENLEQVLAGLSPEMKAITLAQLGFDARVQQAITPLIGFSQAIRDKEAALKSAGGTTDDIVQNQLKAFTAEMKMLWNGITDVARQIGEKLIPAVRYIGREIQSAIDWFNGLSEGTKTTVIVMAALTAAIGPVLLGLGTMAATVGTLIVGYNALIAKLAVYAASSKIAAAAQWVLNMAMKAMPILAAAAAAAAFIALAVAIGRALAGMNELKAAQQERARLDKKWMEMWEKANIQEMNELTGMEDGIKKTEAFAQSIKRVGNNIQGMNSRIAMQKQLLQEMQDEGAEYGKIGSEVYTAEVDNLNQMLEQKEMYKKHQQDIIEAEKHHAQVLADKADIEAGRSIRPELIADETDEIMKLNKELEHQIATYGMTNSQIEIYNAKVKGATDEQLEELQAIADKNDAMEQELQARKDAEKAIEDEKNAAEQLLKTKQQMNQALNDEIAMFGMSIPEQKEYMALQAGMSESDAEIIKIKSEQLEALKAEKKAREELDKEMKRGEQITKSVMTPQEKFKEGQKDLQGLLQKGAIDLETYTRAMEKLKKDTTVQVKFKVSGVDAVAAGSAEAAARLEEFRALSGGGGEKVDFRAQGKKILENRPAAKPAPGIPAEEKEGAKNLAGILNNTRILAERTPVVIEEARI